jgi:hypothetical protein
LLEYRPYLPGEDQGWQSEVDSSLMVRGLQDGRFSYFPGTALPQGNDWQALWDKPERLPRMVRLELDLPAQSLPWPGLVVLLPVSGSVR